jgi:hypothetical protein
MSRVASVDRSAYVETIFHAKYSITLFHCSALLDPMWLPILYLSVLPHGSMPHHTSVSYRGVQRAKAGCPFHRVQGIVSGINTLKHTAGTDIADADTENIFSLARQQWQSGMKAVLLLEQQGHTAKLKCKHTQSFAFTRTHAQAFLSSSDNARGNKPKPRPKLGSGPNVQMSWKQD